MHDGLDRVTGKKVRDEVEDHINKIVRLPHGL